MKYAFIGTYPPRECGIGTFTENLRISMLNNSSAGSSDESYIVAMNNDNETITYPEEVLLTVRQNYQRDYIEAAKFINLSGADICILEHEFGIFGGQNGVYILPLMHKLKIPIIVTLHTIIKEPSNNEKAVLQEICKMSEKIVVMSMKAIDLLVTIYKVPKSKIVRIEHGVPDILFKQNESKNEFKLNQKIVIMTFGFIGRNKGIETMLKALPDIVAKYPNVVYIILGKTHPNVLKYSGEEYRIYLLKLAKKLDIENNVLFLNKFINQKELFKYLSASDIYVTPYIHETQITSGTLSYAVGVGSAVISTPYWHAEELLANNRGKLFNFNASDELAAIILNLLDHPKELKELRKNAFEYGRKITWPKSGKKYLELAEKILTKKELIFKEKESILDPLILPPFSLEHIKRLTDETGIIQHAKYGIPNRKDGYCLDDNARALLMGLMAFNQKKDKQVLELCTTYLSFILYMQNEDGTFKNFLSYKREYLDLKGSEDSFGRTVWALAYLMYNAPNDAFFQSAKDILYRALPNFIHLNSIRSISFTLIGISYFLKKMPSDEGTMQIMKHLVKKIMLSYEKNRTEDWKWFESLLSYDNAVIPLSLLHVSEILKNKKIKKIAFESMNFLSDLTLKDGYLSIIGNEKWYQKAGERSVFDQQPVDAMAMVLMFHQSYILTKDIKYLENLHACFMWFLGENDLRMNLYDFESKGCCDGLERNGVNRNQGAESTLSYLISHLTVLQAFEDFHEIK